MNDSTRFRLMMKSGGSGERVPLRTVLRNFLNHVETLEKRKNGGDDQYDKEFQELKLLGESLRGVSTYSCGQGEKEVNRRKNRYKDILPCNRDFLSFNLLLMEIIKLLILCSRS